MNTWNINPSKDDTAELGQVASEIAALASGLLTSVEHLDNIQFVWELFDKQPSVGRSVVQVHVSSNFFETFFSSPVGYRAMFRRGPYIGSAANGALLWDILSVLSPTMPESLNVPVIKNPGPELVKHYTLARLEFLRSLDPCLAKLWYSTAEIRADGTIRLLPYGVTDGKIDVGLPYHWAEIRQAEQDCIIEIKGAFIGPYGLFQAKDPEERARKLFEKGEA